MIITKNELERKEEQIKAQISYVLQRTTFPVETQYIPLIFRDEIYQIADVQNINFNLFDLQGNLLKSSRPKFDTDTSRISIPSDILNQLDESLSNRYVEKKIAAGDRYQSSYSYITDSQFKPIAILNLPYFEDDSF